MYVLMPYEIVTMDWILCFAVGVCIPLFHELPDGAAVSKSSAFIAKHSYGIYLIHLELLHFALHDLRIGFFIGSLAMTVATLALAVLAYKLIERPMIRYGVLLSNAVMESQIFDREKPQIQTDGAMPDEGESAVPVSEPRSVRNTAA